MCEYIEKRMELKSIFSTIDIIAHIMVIIYKDSQCQSECDLSDLRPFRNGLMSVTSLNAKEIFSWIYCMYLAVSNLFLIKDLCKKKWKKSGNNVNSPLLPIIKRSFERILIRYWRHPNILPMVEKR